MSKYVNRMKDTLVALSSTARRIHGEIEHNNATYQPSAAADANARLQAELNAAVEETRAKIDAIHDEAVAAARKWGELSGVDIDADDLGLLEGDFELSQQAVWHLLVKHQGNGTMVNAIAKYAKEHGTVLNYVPCVEGKLFAYSSFTKSAQAAVGDIVGTAGLIDLSKWGEPGNISQRMETILYGIKEEDDPSTKLPKGDFNFGFKHINGR